MAVLVNAEMEEVDIRPTHRLLRDGNTDALEDFLAEPAPVFRVEPMAAGEVADRLDSARDAADATFGLLLPHGRGYLLRVDPDEAAERIQRERVSTAVDASTWPSSTRPCSPTGWGSMPRPSRPGIGSPTLGTRLTPGARSTPARRRPPSWSVPPGSNSSRRSPWPAT